HADPRVQCAIALIEHQSTTEQIDFRQLALQVNLSFSRFRHVFTQATGVSPKRFIKAIRLMHAKWLMKNTFLSVKQVMAEVGCSDVSHFVRDYKTAFGETPTQPGRAQCRQKISAAFSANHWRASPLPRA